MCLVAALTTKGVLAIWAVDQGQKPKPREGGEVLGARELG